MGSIKNIYSVCVSNSEKLAWKINDLLTEDHKFKFDKRFLPKTLTLENDLSFLSESEKIDLNHIRAASYMNLFGYVEEYIIALVIQLASDSTFDENTRLRALLRFSEEEVKHQILFSRFTKLFNASFKVECEFLDGADDVASTILANSELGVLLLTLHLELITQQHYTESVRCDSELDDIIVLILKKHWEEEAQHSKLDLYEINNIIKDYSEDQIDNSIQEYLDLLDAINDLVLKQAKMDLNALEKCRDKEYDESERQIFIKSQHYSYVYNFVILGLKNKSFRKEISKIIPSFLKILDDKIKLVEKDFIEVISAA